MAFGFAVLAAGCAEEDEAAALMCNRGLDDAQGQRIAQTEGLVGYYTRLPTGDRSIALYGLRDLPVSGPFADVVVSLGPDRRVEIGRGTSYHPVWVVGDERWPFPRLVEVRGDGDVERPDRLNRYAFARIVDADAERVLVHLRYVRDFADPTPTGVVHELLEFRADGSVIREARIGTLMLEAFGAPDNNPTQTLTLRDDGIAITATGTIDRTDPPNPPTPAPERAHPIADAIASFGFDEAQGRSTTDAITGTDAAIAGHLPHWRTGISGTALELDGYTSEVIVPAAGAPQVIDAFTLEAWVALAAYPFNITAIVGRADADGKFAYRVDPEDAQGWCEEERIEDPEADEPPIPIFELEAGGRGYLLGVDANGTAVVMVDVGGIWQHVESDDPIPLSQWTHVVGTYDAAEAMLRVYLDGELAGALAVQGTGLNIPDTLDLSIGRNAVPQVVAEDWCMSPAATAGSLFGVDGLVDEVRVYDRALGADEIADAFAALHDDEPPDLAARGLPRMPLPDAFGPIHITLPYHPTWDALWRSSDIDDLVVGFVDMPTKIAFWRGTSYGPAWIGETDKWFVDQSAEWGDAVGLAEHMSDKQVRYSHVRVLEQTPARVVVHWRYAVNGLTYEVVDEFGELAWVDELYTIYPDGVAIRSVRDWYCNATHEAEDRLGWQAVGFLAEEGTTPLDTINGRAAIAMNPAGQMVELDAIAGTDPATFLADANLVWLDMKAEHKVFLGFPEGVQLYYYEHVIGEPWDRDTSPFSPFETFNHWPASQLPSDGRVALHSDRISSSEGIVHAENLTALGDVALYGFTGGGPEAVLPIVRGWNHPPAIRDITGAAEGRHDKRQHAFVFTGGSDALSFRFEIARDPVIHPAIVVEDWRGSAAPRITIDDVALDAARVHVGIHHNGGVRTLVAWLDTELASPVTLRVQ